MSRNLILAGLLLGLLLLDAVKVRAKELEGFGDEVEEDVDEEFDDVPHAATVPKKSPIEVEHEGDAAPRDAGASIPGEVDEAAVVDAKPALPEWDEDEFEGVPTGQPERVVTPGSIPAGIPSDAKQPPKVSVRVQQPSKPLTLKDHVPEIVLLVFLLIFGVNYFIGSRANEKIALAWAEQFASPGSIFEKNFSLLGTGGSNEDNEPLMIKEGQGIFKFYASGRRFCECILVTLDLKSRHDLLSYLWYLAFPKEDSLKVEVHMNEDSMPPIIMAVMRRKISKAFLKEHKDLKEYCTIMDFSALKKFPSDDLAVIGDCREAATELLNDVILDQLLGDKAFEKYAAKHFISMHFTDQYPATIKRKILVFEFGLPTLGKMGDISKLMASIPYFIDAVAKLTLSSNAKAKAEAARSKAQQAAMKEQQEQKLEELQRRREERRRAEEARMSPAELARKKEKERLKDMKPKARLTRVH